jgi:hypothetical protein
MAVSQALLDQLLNLDDEERLRIAELLLSSVDEDNLDDAERERLHAALARSVEDVRTGRLHGARNVLEELRARHRP